MTYFIVSKSMNAREILQEI